MMLNDRKIILVTGINGFIASRIGYDLLRKGYVLRGTVRSPHSASALLEGAYKQFADRVQVVVITDMTVPGAFDEAVKGVIAIIHTASPINYQLKSWDDFVTPAIKGALGVLEASLKHSGPQLESIVMMSSDAAIRDPSRKNHTFTEDDWNSWAEPKARELGDEAPPYILYPASKTLAERAFWHFSEENKPHFSLTSVNPAICIGPPIQLPPLPSALNETLKPIWEIFSGETQTIRQAMGSGGYIDVRDVAAVSVWCAEHPQEAAGQRYILANGRGTFQAAADILRKAYPDRESIPVGNPGCDYEVDYSWPAWTKFDSSKAAKATGKAFIRYDQSILDTADALKTYLST